MNIALFQCVALQLTKYKKTDTTQPTVIGFYPQQSVLLSIEQYPKTKILSSQNTAYYAGFHILGPLNYTYEKKKKKAVELILTND